jgi:SAM-dependent methyltransferase
MQHTREAVIRAGSFEAEINAAIWDKWFTAKPSHFLRYAVRKYGLDKRSVADVGSAYGHALQFFGPGSFGIEMNPGAAAFSQAIGQTTYCGEFEKVDIPRVSAAWCRDVLEHVDSPHLLLRRLWDVLEDDGLAFLALPLTNAGRHLGGLSRHFRGYTAEDHVNFFTAPTLRWTVERAGFEIVELTAGFGRVVDRLALGFAPACLVVARKVPDWEYSLKSTRRSGIVARKDMDLHGFAHAITR